MNIIQINGKTRKENNFEEAREWIRKKLGKPRDEKMYRLMLQCVFPNFLPKVNEVFCKAWITYFEANRLNVNIMSQDEYRKVVDLPKAEDFDIPTFEEFQSL